MSPTFDDPHILDWLDAASAEDMDLVAFGIIGMAADATVDRYNAIEAERAGMTPSRVIGRNFFTSVGPCSNNAMIAGRFQAPDALDATIDYVFTFRMAVSPVRLRLLKRAGSGPMYLLVERRSSVGR
jgi:photoactive yellow protein